MFKNFRPFTILFSLLSAASFAAALWLLLRERPDGLLAFTALLCGGGAAFIAHIENIETFKLGRDGLEAQMRKIVSEAEVTIGQLHSVAAALARASIVMINAEGRYGGGTTTKIKHQTTQSLLESMRTLGMPGDQILGVLAAERPYVEFDYAGAVANALRKSDLQPVEREELVRFLNAGKQGICRQYRPEDFDAFLVSIGSPDVQQATDILEDYRHYRAKGAHRNLERWFNMYGRG